MKIKVFFIFVVIVLQSVCFSQSNPADSMQISLSYAIQEALKNNDQIKNGQAALKIENAVLDETRSLIFPKADANFSYSYLDIVPGFRSLVLGNIEHDIFPYISVNQILYTGGKVKHSQNAAEAKLHSQEMTFQNLIIELKQTVILSYFQLISIQNQIRILEENKNQLIIHEKFARLLVKAGRISELELNRLAVEIITLDGQLLKLRNDYQLTSNELSVFLGREGQTCYIPTDSLKIEPLAIDTTRMVQSTFENNPLWKKLDWELTRANHQIKMQEAARLPQVSATAWYGYEFGIESFSFDKNDRFFIGLNAQLPLFDGGKIRAKVDQAKSQLESIQWQKKYFEKTLSTQISNLYLRVKEMEAQIAIQKRAIEQAQQSYRMALIEYHAGQRSNTDLLDIQKNLLNSELTLNQAIVNHNKSKVNLLYLIGIL